MYSFHKSKKILKMGVILFRKKKKKISPSEADLFKGELKELQESIRNKNRNQSDLFAKKVQLVMKTRFKKSFFRQCIEGILAITVALAVAVVIRQMWFEFFEIPTGSMRPTLQEKDRLVVSKSQFCLNIPLTTKHFLFEPKELFRNSIVVFTGKNMDIRDVDTTYFYLFPGKKQYIKRLIGKPGDRLYFYNGQMYGIDKEGQNITEDLQPDFLSSIVHIPYIQAEGKVVTPTPPNNGVYSPVIFYQMNLPVLKMYVNPLHEIDHQMLYKTNMTSKMEYYDLWGFKHYAMTRIISKEELIKFFPQQIPTTSSSYYLQFIHHPNFAGAKLEKDLFGRTRPSLGLMYSALPLNESSMKDLFHELYTARFIVEKGYARRYGTPPLNQQNRHYYPYLPGIPDGCYEFYDGQAYQILWQGYSQKLSPSHPLMQFDAPRFLTLFNIGIEFDNRFLPKFMPYHLFPSRFAYFKDEDLYVMGRKFLAKETPTLTQYVRKEKERATLQPQYRPFIHEPIPMVNGQIDKEFLDSYGITVPEDRYLVLGDNYAMSADSRDFGFVPQENLRGVPDFIFWPFGSRFGSPLQVSMNLFTTPRMIVWAIAALCFIIWKWIHRRRYSIPYKDLE